MWRQWLLILLQVVKLGQCARFSRCTMENVASVISGVREAFTEQSAENVQS